VKFIFPEKRKVVETLETNKQIERNYNKEYRVHAGLKIYVKIEILL